MPRTPLTRRALLAWAALAAAGAAQPPRPKAKAKAKSKAKARAKARGAAPTPEDRDRLLAALGDTPRSPDDPDGEAKRRRLRAALEPYGDRKVEELSGILQSGGSFGVRLGAAYALGELGDPKGVPALLDFAVEAGDAAAEIEAGRALGRIDDPAVIDAILREVKNGDRARLNGACNAMAYLTQPAFVPKILPLLDDRRPVVQLRAVEALGSIGDRAAVPALQALMRRSTDFATRFKVNNALAQIEARNRKPAPGAAAKGR